LLFLILLCAYVTILSIVKLTQLLKDEKYDMLHNTSSYSMGHIASISNTIRLQRVHNQELQPKGVTNVTVLICTQFIIRSRNRRKQIRM